MGFNYQRIYAQEIILDSFNRLVIAIKKPITIIATPAQTRFTNGFMLAETLKTSLVD